MIKVHQQLKGLLLSSQADGLYDAYEDLSLIHLKKGTPSHSVAVSILIHGNETSSLKILQDTIQNLQSSCEDYSLLILLGNLSAAKESVRHLVSQPDFNRIWVTPPDGYKVKVSGILQYMRDLNPYCLIDLHNNTGSNPPYACVSTLNPETVGLASMFSGRVVYFPKKLGLLIDELASSFPSVVFECGLNMEAEPIKLAVDVLQKVIQEPWDLEFLKQAAKPVQPRQTVGRFLVQGVGCVGEMCFTLTPDIESKNFHGFRAGETFATGTNISSIRYIDDEGRDLTSEVFVSEGEHLRFKKDVYPCMLTRDLDVALSDCIGYLLETV